MIKLYSGIKIKTGVMPWSKKDILELGDAQFISVIVNTLRTFNWDGKGVGDVLIERVVTSYLSCIHDRPELKNYCRITAILTLQDMGKKFVKDEQQWNQCLEELGLLPEE